MSDGGLEIEARVEALVKQLIQTIEGLNAHDQWEWIPVSSSWLPHVHDSEWNECILPLKNWKNYVFLFFGSFWPTRRDLNLLICFQTRLLPVFHSLEAEKRCGSYVTCLLCWEELANYYHHHHQPLSLLRVSHLFLKRQLSASSSSVPSQHHGPFAVLVSYFQSEKLMLIAV